MTRVRRPSGVVGAIAAAWLIALGFDLFLHGGLLARLYLEPSPFLLPPRDAFLRIPIGYLTFLGLTVALSWLFRRLDVRGAMAGFRLGAAAGATVWGALVLGLYSISTASPALLGAWWIGQTLELGLSGAVLGAAAQGVSARRLWVIVWGTVAVCVVVTVLLQSLGLVPTVRFER